MGVNLATWVYERHLAARGVRRRAWSLLRKLLVRFLGDPACSMTVHGVRLSLPLSHALPLYLQEFPHYDRLPRRLSEFVRRTHGRLCCIDVGANVGDTVAAFRADDADAFLAIEPNPAFQRYLAANWGGKPNVELASELCSSGSECGTFTVREKSGTASIVEAAEGTPMARRRLDEIVADHSLVADANVLKVDTDGHDFEVLAGATGVLARNRPAVLFECDVFGNANYVEDCLRTFETFRGCGYRHFLLYSNFGDLMGRHALSDPGPFLDLLFYQLTSAFAYFDILVMRDEDLFPFHEAEIAHFAGTLAPALQHAARRAAELGRAR